jgi:hypothetical protein
MRHSEEFIRAVTDIQFGDSVNNWQHDAAEAAELLDAIRAAEDADPGRDRQLADTIAAVLIASPFVRLDDITGPMVADVVARAIVADFHVSMREESTETPLVLNVPEDETADDRRARAFKMVSDLQRSAVPLVPGYAIESIDCECPCHRAASDPSVVKCITCPCAGKRTVKPPGHHPV